MAQPTLPQQSVILSDTQQPSTAEPVLATPAKLEDDTGVPLWVTFGDTLNQQAKEKSDATDVSTDRRQLIIDKKVQELIKLTQIVRQIGQSYTDQFPDATFKLKIFRDHVNQGVARDMRDFRPTDLITVWRSLQNFYSRLHSSHGRMALTIEKLFLSAFGSHYQYNSHCNQLAQLTCPQKARLQKMQNCIGAMELGFRPQLESEVIREISQAFPANTPFVAMQLAPLVHWPSPSK